MTDFYLCTETREELYLLDKEEKSNIDNIMRVSLCDIQLVKVVNTVEEIWESEKKNELLILLHLFMDIYQKPLSAYKHQSYVGQ